MENISPWPIIPLALQKRGRNVATIFTSPENIKKARLLKKTYKTAVQIKSVLKPTKRALLSSESDEDFEPKENSDSDIN